MIWQSWLSPAVPWRGRTLAVTLVAAAAIAIGAGLALGLRDAPALPDQDVTIALPERLPRRSSAGIGDGDGDLPAPLLPTVSQQGTLMAPAVAPSAYARIDEVKPGEPLAPAPDPALIEVKPFGHLPRIAADGRMPRTVYARPFDQRDDRPRIAIVVVGLGLSPTVTEAALRRLPAAATLAYDAHTADAERQARIARRDGHEVLLAVPAEAGDPPFDDPGGDALLSSLPVADNVDRLERLLGRFPGYVGIAAPLASRLGRDKETPVAIANILNGRGLLLLDTSGAGPALPPPALPGAVSGPGPVSGVMPTARVDVVIDARPTPEAIDAQLRALETLARQRLVAVGTMQATPLAVARLRSWSETLADRGIVLAPVSAVAGRQME